MAWKDLVPLVTVIIMMAVLYPIAQATATDTIHSVVEQGVAAGQQGLTTINYVGGLWQLLLVMVHAGVLFLVYRSHWYARRVATCTMIAGVFGMLAIALLALQAIPGLAATWGTFPVIEATFIAFVLGDITVFLGIQTVILVGASAAFVYAARRVT